MRFCPNEHVQHHLRGKSSYLHQAPCCSRRNACCIAETHTQEVQTTRCVCHNICERIQMSVLPNNCLGRPSVAETIKTCDSDDAQAERCPAVLSLLDTVSPTLHAMAARESDCATDRSRGRTLLYLMIKYIMTHLSLQLRLHWSTYWKPATIFSTCRFPASHLLA